MAIFNGTVENIENTKNKVIEINENSTNEQYPSAKAVYDITNWKLISNETITGDSAVTKYIKDLGGKYKKLAIFITLAYDSNNTSKGYINGYVNGSENADRIISADPIIPMPTASGKVTLVKIISEMAGKKVISSLQYLGNAVSESAGRYLQTTGDLMNTWFPIKKGYIETLQLNAVTMAFTVGTKIEIYGVRA